MGKKTIEVEVNIPEGYTEEDVSGAISSLSNDEIVGLINGEALVYFP